MIAASSPFDEALSRPFLGEPSKKKWATGVMASSPPRNQDSKGVPIITAPKVIVQPQKMVEQELDLAILMERDAEISGLAKSMREIHDIQSDLALLVDSQSLDIESLGSLAIEASENAETGLLAVEETARKARDRRSRDNKLYLLVVATLLLFVACYGWSNSGAAVANVEEKASLDGESVAFNDLETMEEEDDFSHDESLDLGVSTMDPLTSESFMDEAVAIGYASLFLEEKDGIMSASEKQPLF